MVCVEVVMSEAKTVYRYLAAGGGSDTYAAKIKWCEENLYHGGHYEPKWRTQYPFIVFEDEKEYIWFMLRWS